MTTNMINEVLVQAENSHVVVAEIALTKRSPLLKRTTLRHILHRHLMIKIYALSHQLDQLQEHVPRKYKIR